MADQQRDRQQSGRTEQNDEIEQNEQSGRRVVGRGMTSPDSTEAVLDASTGEPDPRARGTSGERSSEDEQDRNSRSR